MCAHMSFQMLIEESPRGALPPSTANYRAAPPMRAGAPASVTSTQS